ncbi:MAG: MlrC C-terminal domain-containing protein, partial [Pseudomonadota bacterium]
AADRAADDLAANLWARREHFVPELVPVDQSVEEALNASQHPVVLVDVADNVGGGAPGDGTVLLQALLDAGAKGACIVIWDPAAAAACHDLGTGARFQGKVGGKADDRHGQPAEIDGMIAFAAPVTYQRGSSYMTGQRVDLGRVGVVDANGVLVVLTERRAMPFDADHLRVVGIDPARQRILVCKSAIGWRAAFGDIAAHHMLVTTPGVCSADLTSLPFRKGQALYPLNPDATWPP